MPQRTPLKPISGNKTSRKELSPFFRGKIIALSELGTKITHIARQLEIPRKTVEYTIRKNPEREDGESKYRSGRPCILDKHDIRHIIQLVMEEPFITYQAIIHQQKLTCSPRTIYSALQSQNIGHWKARQRPLLLEEHAKMRLEFAIKYASWTYEDWKKVIFTDECSIELGSGKRGKWVFRLNRVEEKWKLKYVQPIKKGKGVRIMVWAAICGNSRSDLLQLAPDFESKKQGYSSVSYIEILEEMVPTIYEPGLVFMQDNCYGLVPPDAHYKGILE
jgi:transposase